MDMVGHFQEFEDEYLETMYEFYEHDPLQRVRTGALASRLGVAPASATEMIQRLAARGYLEYIPLQRGEFNRVRTGSRSKNETKAPACRSSS